MEVGEVGEVLPDGGGKGGEEEGDEEGEEGEGWGESSWLDQPRSQRRDLGHPVVRWEGAVASGEVESFGGFQLRALRFAQDDRLFGGDGFAGPEFFEEEDEDGGGGQEKEGEGEEADGVVDGVVGGVGGGGEEEVVLVTHVGEEGHGCLDVAALVGGGEEVEGGEG